MGRGKKKPINSVEESKLDVEKVKPVEETMLDGEEVKLVEDIKLGIEETEPAEEEEEEGEGGKQYGEKEPAEEEEEEKANQSFEVLGFHPCLIRALSKRCIRNQLQFNNQPFLIFLAMAKTGPCMTFAYLSLLLQKLFCRL